jgi:predicted CXXCH cytochrome family protein
MKNSKDGKTGWVSSRLLENYEIIVFVGLFLLVFSPVLSCAQKSQATGRGSPSQTQMSSPPEGSPLIFAQQKNVKQSSFSHPAIQEGDSCVSEKCHAEMGTASYVHTPIAQGSCNFCHDLAASRARYGLRKSDLDLCLSCHEDQKTFYNQEVVHPPVEIDCISCHNPHQSPYRFQLESGPSSARLCFTCHDEDDKMEYMYLHGPVKSEDCLACHNPHASNYKHLVREGPQEIQLCDNCHEEIPKKIKNSTFKHGVINEGLCSPCHAFHGSNLTKHWTRLFPDKFYNPYDPELYGLCFQCHRKAKAFLEKSTTLTNFRNGKRNLHYLHVTRRKGRTCIACHDIHATNQERLIRSSTPFGPSNFHIHIVFVKTPTGGTCVKSCHVSKGYDREKPLELQVDTEPAIERKKPK